MTQYMLGVFMPKSGPELSPDEMRQSGADVDALNQKMVQAGAHVFAGGFDSGVEAKVARKSGGQIVVTDGPFVETKEELGGFWILEAADIDAALDWARQATVACRASIEIRQFASE